jgi:hypothetical protein
MDIVAVIPQIADTGGKAEAAKLLQGVNRRKAVAGFKVTQDFVLLAHINLKKRGRTLFGAAPSRKTDAEHNRPATVDGGGKGED